MNHAWLGLKALENVARLGLKPWTNPAGLGLQPGVHQDGLGLSHGVNLLRGDLGCRDGEGGLGHLLRATRLGLGDKDIGLALVDAVAPAVSLLGAHVATREHLVVPQLRAGHVDLVGGSQDPVEQQLLQLHPQDVAVLLRHGGGGGWGRGRSPPALQHHAGGGPWEGQEPHLDQDMAALVAGGEDDGAVRPGVEPVEADGAVGHVKVGAELIYGGGTGHHGHGWGWCVRWHNRVP